MTLKISSFHEPQSGTWTHLVADDASRSAVIIDPVWVFDPVSGTADLSFTQQLLDQAEAENFDIEWVLETHAHADHLTAADQIRQRTGARIACGRGIRSVQKNFTRVFNMSHTPIDGSQFDRLLVEGDIIKLGALEIHVIETPGHTNDSVTYVIEDAAFVGDTLFAPSFGTARCDFPGGDAAQLYDSIARIYSLPDDTRLFLCHDYPKEGDQAVPMVPLAESKRDNIHFSEGTSREDYVSMRQARDAQLGLPRLILPSLQVNILAGALPDREDNGVAYLRTPFNKNLASLIGEGN